MSPSEITTLITALGAAIGVILTAWAVVVRARKGAGKVANLLQRLVDWMDSYRVEESDVGRTVTDLLPARLAATVDDAFDDRADDGE